MSSPESALRSAIKVASGRAHNGALLWSAAHHGSGALSILFSGAAAFIAAAHPTGLSGLDTTRIAALSGFAATFTAISAFAGFSKKWRVNRDTRLELDLLQLNWNENEIDKLRDRFERIMRAHERGIVGAEPE